MYGDFSRTRLIRQAWKAVGLGRFSDAALFDSVVSLADDKLRPKLRQALPAVWLQLDAPGDASDWITVTGLDGEAIDALQTAVGVGLPERGKKVGLHSYALRPQDFPALLFLAFIAARLATPYEGGGPHRKVRAQFWYAPELAVILMRCLPPKLDLLTVEHILRVVLQAPAGERPPMPLSGMVPMLGLPDLGSSYTGLDTIGMIEEDEADEKA